MMDEYEFITSLMDKHTEELGFIPNTTVEFRYIKRDRFVVQHDNRGRSVGYILHGKPTPGGILTIAQACIEVDKRNRGFGMQAVNTVVERAKTSNVRMVKLRCADNLDSNLFWQACGFIKVRRDTPNNRRQRAINTYVLDLWPRLFSDESEAK